MGGGGNIYDCIKTDNQARSQGGGGGGGGGGVGGVVTPPSGINDIHNSNYLIQERPLDCF